MLPGELVLKKIISTVPHKPGVYRLLDKEGTLLYVGKAKDLKKRLESYARGVYHSVYIPSVLEQLSHVEITLVTKEADALLLEASLIRTLKPRYNILHRLGRVFPYICIEKTMHPFPRLAPFRGRTQKKNDIYFGPFTSYKMMHKSLEMLEKTFLLRSCADHVFKNRSRPCLLHQIDRCSAPCVGKISKEDYARHIEQAQAFFKGETKTLKKSWTNDMKQAVKAENFEEAAFYRDRLATLDHISTVTGHVAPTTFSQADLFACHIEGERASIQVFFFRAHQNLGNTSYKIKVMTGTCPGEILAGFIPQFYQKNSPPKYVITHALSNEDKSFLEETYSLRVLLPSRGEKHQFLMLALANAQNDLIGENNVEFNLLGELSKTFFLDQEIPQRIEIYDNSHIQGKYPLGVMVVYTPDGFDKNEYRIFNMRGDHRGNDLEMMKEVFVRRFSNTQLTLPDFILIDGGPTQLKVAYRCLTDQGIHIPMVGMAKGKERNAGKERFYLPNGTTIPIQPNTPLIHLLQRLRDEAHRFAIYSHRRRRLRDAL